MGKCKKQQWQQEQRQDKLDHGEEEKTQSCNQWPIGIQRTEEVEGEGQKLRERERERKYCNLLKSVERDPEKETPKEV